MHSELARAAVTAPTVEERARRRAETEWLRKQMDPMHPSPITEGSRGGSQDDGEAPGGPVGPTLPAPAS